MSYDNFAYYYDSLMDPQFYDDYLQFILQQGEFYDVLELGCGTGELAIRMAKKGINICATDLSEEMLTVAREKALAHHLFLNVKRVDMSDFLTTEPVDLVLCLCDSINYLIEEENVIKTFQNVYNSLKDNGIFIFDIDSLYKMNTILKDYHEKEEDTDISFSWNVETIDDGYVCHHIHIQDHENQEIVDEKHYQKTYSLNQYLFWLEDVGFSHIDYYSDFTNYHEKCERIIFVCRKKV